MNHPPVIFLALARWDSPYSSTAFALARKWLIIDRSSTWKIPYTERSCFGLSQTTVAKANCSVVGTKIFLSLYP
ncbi:MAG: hypothetical protein R3B93_03860 [Bacteroidia bacterium]